MNPIDAKNEIIDFFLNSGHKIDHKNSMSWLPSDRFDAIRPFYHNRNTILYFLVREGKIVYVGVTGNLFKRIRTHRLLKDFDVFIYVFIGSEQVARAFESLFIFQKKPLYNRIPTGKNYKPNSWFGHPKKILRSKRISPRGHYM